MFWYIGALVSFILLIVGIIILNNSCDFEFFGFILTMISAIFLIISVIVIPLCTIIDKQDVNTFKKQKEYIESHVSKNDIEDAALTTKKIELNEWLYNAQYSKLKYSIFSFMPDEILGYEPIKW